MTYDVTLVLVAPRSDIKVHIDSNLLPRQGDEMLLPNDWAKGLDMKLGASRFVRVDRVVWRFDEREVETDEPDSARNCGVYLYLVSCGVVN